MTDIEFSDIQKDAVIELINLGIGRAASALEDMIQEEVHLSVPDVEFSDYASLGEELEQIDNKEPSVIMQQFNGDFSGNAILLFPEQSGMSLVRRMLKDSASEEQISELEEEALTEIGNIILNACFGQIAELLSTELAGDVPHYLREQVEGILKKGRPKNGTPKSTKVMMLQVNFSLLSSETKGFVVFLMDVESMHTFKQKIDDYLDSLFG
jgi:chemotaxis protein CheC